MSSEFQATLNSKAMQAVPVDVAFGSRVSLRHHNTQGGYLHSHNHMYPEGSKQQQITLYPHKDENNVFLLENQTQPEGLDGPIVGPMAWNDLEPILIEDGAILKLYHITTDRRLHSHDQRPPVTEADWQFEVSAYGFSGFEGDANDLFKVEIVKSMSDGEAAKTRLRTIQSKFKLVHVMTGCVLFSHKVKLPDWGFEQQEVTCAKGGTLPNSVWYIEQNEHPMLGEASEKVNYRDPGFLGKFWELQRVMWTTNAGLVESHAWDSRPPSWPILKRGINFWGKDHRQIYLMGNPVIWLSSTAAIAIYLVVKGLAVLRWQRGYKDYTATTFKRFDYEVGSMVLGWAFHYFPFFLMQRQLFLHHYFPALYFAIIALCQVYDFVHYRFGGIGLRKRPAIGQATAVAFLAVSIVAFTMYSPLAYGNQWTKDACNKVKLLDTWDWDCNNFLNTVSKPSTAIAVSQSLTHVLQYDDYSTYTPVAANVPSSSAPLIGGDVKAPPASPPPVEVTPGIGEVDGNGYSIINREEKIEYRDEAGNLLDPEQVKAMEGQISFSTRYETRTRLVDAEGREVKNPDEFRSAQQQQEMLADERAPEGVAPPHPDVDGLNPETAMADGEITGQKPTELPPTVDAGGDQTKESSVVDEETKAGEAKPRSERDEATGTAQT